MSALSAVYGGVARLRRSWYARRPHARVRLPRPVVSVGNLVVGGSGKTPVVESLARTLVRLGHRPAILSRGYGRTTGAGDLVIVSDGGAPLVPVEQSGDEPQMLARNLTGVPVVVCADRYRAGRAAIEQFDATVLILDDGFQHVRLERTLDLLVMTPSDLNDQVLPAGRLREPVAAARVAHAVLVYGEASEATAVGAAAGVARTFVVRSHYASLTLHGGGALPPDHRRVIAVAGIARPRRFFDAVRRQGHDVARECVFRDHHWFTAADVRHVEQLAASLHADLIVTTAKDAVRLGRHARDFTRPWAILPMSARIEPAAEFDAWLRQRL